MDFAKINFTATDIFTEKKMEEICQSTHNINVPVVTEKNINYLILMKMVMLHYLTMKQMNQPKTKNLEIKK